MSGCFQNSICSLLYGTRISSQATTKCNTLFTNNLWQVQSTYAQQHTCSWEEDTPGWSEKYIESLPYLLMVTIQATVEYITWRTGFLHLYYIATKALLIGSWWARDTLWSKAGYKTQFNWFISMYPHRYQPRVQHHNDYLQWKPLTSQHFVRTCGKISSYQLLCATAIII